MNIGERLKQERVRLGFNQGDFAALAGVAKTSQFNYEKGDRSPDAEYLSAVAGAGVDVLYVVTGQRTPLAAESIGAEDNRLLALYHALCTKDQEAVSHLLLALAATNRDSTV